MTANMLYYKNRKVFGLGVGKSMYLLVIDYSEHWEYFFSGSSAVLSVAVYSTDRG